MREVTSNILCEDNLINGGYYSINSEFLCLLPEALLLLPSIPQITGSVTECCHQMRKRNNAGLVEVDIVYPAVESYVEEEVSLLCVELQICIEIIIRL